MTTALIAAITWPVERSGGGFENALHFFFFSFLQLSHTISDRRFPFARWSLSQVRATLETPWFGRTVIIIIIIAACNPCDYVIYIFMFRNNSLLADEEAKTIRELRSWDSLGLLL